ncbi:hypothetical protein [Rhodopseudomonas sp. RCAM05734]|uniref:hypothetical protein n=1 Tax=Rhodopseudomonas sp. RCAM05734 TaxID=3457549 RepID=UPI0040439597
MKQFAQHSPLNPAVSLGIALLVLAAAALFQLVHALGTPSPIYGGDEYAYFASGLSRANLPDIWLHDPYLQRVVNPLFLALIDRSARAFPDPAAVIRLLGVFSYLAMAGFVGGFVLRRGGKLPALVAVILTCLLPSSGYAAAVMPEVLFYAAVVAAVLVLALPTSPAAGALLAGLLTAVAFLLKPHAISVLVGVIAGQLALMGLLLAQRRPWRGVAMATAVYLGATYVFITLSSALLGSLQFDPRFLLGEFYSSAARTTVGSAADGLGWIAYYLAANASGVLLYTFPFLALMILKARDLLRTDRAIPLDLRPLTLLVITVFVAGATLLMVAMFTYAAGASTPSEAMRLHGRYYAYLLILIFTGALSIPRWDTVLTKPVFASRLPWLDGYRLVGAGWLVCGSLFLTLIWRFQILPWDNPELQAIFRNETSVWQSPVHIRWFAIATPLALAGAALALLARSRFAPACMIAALGAAFVMGTVNTTKFQHFQIASSQFLTQAGRFASEYFPRTEADKVLVVGTDRYGAMAYVLFGMACRCNVLVVEDGKQLTRANLPPGTRMIFAVRSYPVEFATELLFKAPAGSLHRVID